MIKSKKAALAIGAALIAVELVLGILIQLKSHRWLCYSSVIIAVICSLLFTKTDLKSIFIAAGLIFTSCADVCLVLLNPIQQILGMVFFTATQTCYAIGIYHIGKERISLKWSVLPRVALLVALELAALLVLGDAMDTLVVITMVYFALLLTNTALAFIGKKDKLLAFGMLAFIGCDVFVGLEVLANQYVSAAEGTLLYSLTHTGFNTAWLFYVPSQTLIALSVIASGMKKMNSLQKMGAPEQLRE